jgi:hypothetical protein
MKIEFGVTKGFDNYQVFVEEENPWWRKLLKLPRVRTELENILEADDSNGYAVIHLANEAGELLFTNGRDEIIYSNEAKLLLLVPAFHDAFLRTGFKPKISATYIKNLKIVNNNPTVEVAIQVQESVEQQNQAAA